MSRLILVRHGQASFGAADYDQLSPLGERQSRRVGERLARERPRALIYCGPRRRHLQTAQAMVAAARAIGVEYSEPIVERDLDELPVRELILAHGIGDDLWRSLAEAVQRWAKGELAPPGVVTPAEFVSRVESVLERLFPRGDQAAVLVTSGGPIAVPLLRAGALSDIGEALRHGLQLANGSITELLREDGRLRLSPGDPVAHLAPDEITRV